MKEGHEKQTVRETDFIISIDLLQNPINSLQQLSRSSNNSLRMPLYLGRSIGRKSLEVQDPVENELNGCEGCEEQGDAYFQEK